MGRENIVTMHRKQFQAIEYQEAGIRCESCGHEYYPPRPCDQCGRIYEPQVPHQRFCGDVCRKDWHLRQYHLRRGQ
jgi:uncharacterized OB-fold protein